jgi:hypothetical protein
MATATTWQVCFGPAGPAPPFRVLLVLDARRRVVVAGDVSDGRRGRHRGLLATLRFD